MKALQYREIGAEPEVVEVETPEPGPGQVRLKVSAAGACHSDSFLMGLPEEQYTFGLPLTLGHEGIGVVDKLGEGVTGLALGESVAVYGPQGCGRCYQCAQGKENYCERAAELNIAPPLVSVRPVRWPSTCSCPTRAISCRSGISIRSRTWP